MMTIEKVENGHPDMLANREIYWQHHLKCFMENGEQAHCKGKER
jgi:hypothetical protein